MSEADQPVRSVVMEHWAVVGVAEPGRRTVVMGAWTTASMSRMDPVEAAVAQGLTPVRWLPAAATVWGMVGVAAAAIEASERVAAAAKEFSTFLTTPNLYLRSSLT